MGGITSSGTPLLIERGEGSPLAMSSSSASNSKTKGPNKKGKSSGPPNSQELESGDFFRSVFSLAPRGAKWQYNDPSAFPPLMPYEVTLLLSAHRRTTEESVLVSIDALDVRAMSEDVGQPAEGAKNKQ